MPSIQTDRARQLGRSMTAAERRLWRRLRARGMSSVEFRRQHPVGPYVVDFCCPERMVVVEIDGGHHATQAEEDRTRTEFLAGNGFRVLRFWNNEVMGNIAGVLHRISEAAAGPLTPSRLPLTLPSPPVGERTKVRGRGRVPAHD